ncbi:MAG: hypothetical protein ACRDYB_12200 [Acidimicrobiales bacterium]
MECRGRPGGPPPVRVLTRVSGRPRRPFLAALAAALSVLCLAASAPAATFTPWSPHDGSRLLVGAYYYQWFPQNLAQGTTRADLIPPQGPDPRTDVSSNPKTAERAIRQARRAGVNFFALDWWPKNRWYGRTLAEKASDDANTAAFLRASNLKQIRFCMFYETFGLDFDPRTESTPVNPDMELEFDADMLALATHYFHYRNYLRIHGRPVVVLYLTRTLTGDVAGMIQGARQLLAAHGYHPYFIGDEVYWRVTDETLPASGPTLTTTPQASRIEEFDAITAYTYYFGGNPPQYGPTQDFSGYPGDTSVIADQLALMQRYRDATGGRVPVIPDVSPGFNDRGVRLATNHPAQPREWRPGDGPASTLDHFFRDFALPSVDPRLPMVFVTAWNEWNEDTGVEPVPGVPTTRDDSPSGDAYTQGYPYGGEGDSALVTLRRDIDCADGLGSCPAPTAAG